MRTVNGRFRSGGDHAGRFGKSLAAASSHERGRPAFHACKRICQPLLVIGILIFFVLGCRLPGFLRQSNSNDPIITSGNTSAPGQVSNADTAPTGDARADVIRASKKFLDLPYFSASMEGEGKTPMHIELDYQQPDRFHMVYRQPGGELQNETIIIGRDMYIRYGDKWQKIGGALGKTVPQIRQFFDEKGLESLTDVSYIGEDAVAGRDAYVYSYRNEAKKGESPYPFTSKIWIRETDGLPAKIQVDYEGGELRTLSIVYDYEKTVKIEPPTK